MGAKPRYKLKDGTGVISVTQLIDKYSGLNKHALLAWTRKMAMEGKDPKKIKEDAASTGTLVHAYIESYIKKEDIDTLKKDATFESIIVAEKALEQYKQWEKENKIEYIAVEQEYVSDVFKFGGRIDYIIKKDNKIILLDIKTSKGIYWEMYMQLGGYNILYHEATNKAVEEGLFLHINKGATIEDNNLLEFIPVSAHELSLGEDAFFNLLDYKEIVDKFNNLRKDNTENEEV